MSTERENGTRHTFSEPGPSGEIIERPMIWLDGEWHDQDSDEAGRFRHAEIEASIIARSLKHRRA